MLILVRIKTHIWNLTKAFPGKVNFIDSNNVILGYDLERSCCEYAFWNISEDYFGNNPIYMGDSENPQEIELDGYCFDPEFYHRSDSDDSVEQVATFKLIGDRYTNPKLPDLFLRLGNHHNGYYSHGFVFRGSVIVDGSV
jgi:hypothetical protein